MPADIDIAGVTFASASAWLRGEFSVGERIADSPLDLSQREVVFANTLGDRASYRAAMATVHQLARAGCRGLVTHACGDVMPRRWQRQGAISALTEHIVWRGQQLTAHRMILPPAAFEAWLKKTAIF